MVQPSSVNRFDDLDEERVEGPIIRPPVLAQQNIRSQLGLINKSNESSSILFKLGLKT